MREVIYNYLDTEVSRKRRTYTTSSRNSKIIEESEESMENSVKVEESKHK